MGMFFGRKKNSDEDKLIDNLTEDSEAQPSQASASLKGTSDVRIEKLDARINALREILQSQQERFERHGEEIGELRSILADREKQIHDLEAKANRASELVEEVQPENLMSEQRKTDAKLEAVNGKLENNEIISGNIMSELKEIRNKIKVFRGVDDIIALNREVKDELGSIRKVEAVVEKHSDRVEAIFTSVESSFESSEKLKDEVKSISESFSSLKTDIQKNSVAIKGIPQKDELYHLKNDIISSLDTLKKDKELYSQRNKYLESGVKSLVKRTDIIEPDFDSLSKDVKGLSKTSDLTVSQVNKSKDNIDSMLKVKTCFSKDIGALMKDTSENSRRIDLMMNIIGRLAGLSAKQ